MDYGHSRRKYSQISYKKRMKLIDMVEVQKIGVSKAARKLRIKIPTAKVILSSYRKKGKIFMKKSQQSKIRESTVDIPIQPEINAPQQALNLPPPQSLPSIWYYSVVSVLPDQPQGYVINF